MTSPSFVKGDILSPFYIQQTRVFVCHQVNCRGVMGAGLARQIRSQFPAVYDDYKTFCDMKNAAGESPLGHILVCDATGDSGLSIVNVFGQDNYGHGKQFTDYTALFHAFSELAELCMKQNTPPVVRIPYLMGCGIGGGDWTAVSRIIRNTLLSRNIRVEIWKL